MAPLKADRSATLVRFLFVGGMSSFSYSVIITAIIQFTDLPIFLSGVVLYCLFIPVTFHAHKSFSFKAKMLKKGAFARYVALQVGCFALVSFVSSQHVDETFFLNTMLVYYITVVTAAVLSFAVGRYLIFDPQA
jgi:putative flippase GtrA